MTPCIGRRDPRHPRRFAPCLYRGLLEEGVFRRLVRIRREAGRRIYEVEVLE